MVEFTPPPPPPFLPRNTEIRKELTPEHVKIQIAIFLTFLVFALILIFGRIRTRGNTFFKFISSNLFIITASLISYIPGLISAPGQNNDLYVFWVAFMAYLAAASNEVSCYTLGDNEDRKKRLIIDYAVVWPLILSTLYKSLVAPEVLVPIVIIFCVVALKLRERSRALLYATNTSDGFSQSTKIISIYDKHRKADASESNHSSTYYNNFLVGIREAHKLMAKQSKYGRKTRINFFDSSFNSELITLDKVLNPNETFLVSTDVGKELQNTCISFVMFSVLLAKKFAGYDDVDTKIYRGAYNKLPHNSFALVEKELDFLYDYLFTNYYAIYDRGAWRKLCDICVIFVFFWLALPLLVDYYAQDHNILYVYWLGLVLDNGFTRFVILAIIFIEFAQVGIFLTSKWAKVMYTCAYLRNQIPTETKRSPKKKFLQSLLRVACIVPRPRLSLFCFSNLSKRQIGQYSILDCYCEIPKAMWLRCWIGSYFELPRLGQAGDKKIDLTPELQESIVNAINHCLSNHEGKITNGVSSLEENQIDQDGIHCYLKEMSQAQIILIWHIATSLIEESTRKKQPSSNQDADGFQATTTIISNYCAYLVVFLPKMLPDHVYTTRCEFDETVKDLENELFDIDEEDPNEKLNNGDSSSTLVQARKLAEKLLEVQHPNLWRTLADFWIETLLYLALSDHAEAIEAHANGLCIGGEFITHLWALLTHAGCSRKHPAIKSTVLIDED